jgi:hypothetical protein
LISWILVSATSNGHINALKRTQHRKYINVRLFAVRSGNLYDRVV